MKKKILLGSIASLFAIATVFNMGLLSFNKQSDATLEAITVMAEAGNEIENENRDYEINPWYLWPTQGLTKDEREERRPCYTSKSNSANANASHNGTQAGGSYKQSQTNPNGRYEIICPHGYNNCTAVRC